MFHPDKKTSSQAPYSVGPDGTEGWRTTRRTEPEPEAGEPQVGTSQWPEIQESSSQLFTLHENTPCVSYKNIVQV